MTTYAGEDVEKGEHSSTACGSVNLYSHFEITMAIPQENGNQSTTEPGNPTLRHIPK